MPGPYVVPVHGDEDLPDKVDVVVIGGGIVGASTALELADRGHKVALCEKGGIGKEQSGRNWGWVRMTDRDPREVPLMSEALRLWAQMNQRTCRDTGYTRCGIIFADDTEKAFAAHRRWIKNLEPYQLEPKLLSPSEFEALFPDSKMKVVGAVYSPFDGRAEPHLAVPAIAEAARERGASILVECAVRGFETTTGRVSSVITERGTIACDAVVLAGGVWSNLLARRHGIGFPLLDVMASVMRTKPLTGGPEQTVSTGEFGFRRRRDGGYNVAEWGGGRVDIVPNSFRYARQFLQAAGTQRLKYSFGTRFFRELAMARPWSMNEASPFEYNRVLDPRPARHLQRVLAKVAELFPVFKSAEIAQSWAGYIDVTPDAIPVISAVDAVPGFYIATGLSGHGFGLGPGAGLLMADIVTGRSPIVDPSPFRFARFSDGSPIRAFHSHQLLTESSPDSIEKKLS